MIFFSGCQLLSTRNQLHHTIRPIMPRPKKRVAQCTEARRIGIRQSLDLSFCQSLESPSISVLSSMQMAPRSVRFPRAARKDSLLEICSAINTCFPVFTCQDCMMRVPHSSHPGLTPFLRPDIAGSGLNSEIDIPGGTFLIDYIGSISTQPVEGPYVLEAFLGKLWIDGACGGNESRLINHSCDPNSIMHIEPTTHRAMIFARRAIASGEEVTLSYGRHLPFECLCAICCNSKVRENLRGVGQPISN